MTASSAKIPSRPSSPASIERTPLLSASRRYYPGFFGALFLVALRMCIGWHFFYEARHKLESTSSDRPFSAEVYLRNATGPLAPKFRSMVPDANSLSRLDFERLTADWKAELDHVSGQYAFDPEQRAASEKALEDKLAVAKSWFEEPETTTKLTQYKEDLELIEQAAEGGPSIAYQEERFAKRQAEIEAVRKELIAPINAWTTELRHAWIGLTKPDQLQVTGSYAPPTTEIDRLNAIVMYGMLACGLCLMLGLLTPLAALGAAGFLAMFYFSMPPWPGLPPNPQAEGNYLFVNKNLIELFACLVIAATPNGLWVGLDALLFGWIGRGAARRREAQAQLVDSAA